MTKRWVVFYVKPDKTGERSEEVKNMTEAITILRFDNNAHSASFTAAKNIELARKITISKKMAIEAAYLCGDEYKLPEGCKFGPEWI